MYIKNNKLYTKIYRKQTNRQSFLHIDSEHPKSLKVSFSYIQAIRNKRICTTSQDFDYHCKELKQRFLEQRFLLPFISSFLSSFWTVLRWFSKSSESYPRYDSELLDNRIKTDQKLDRNELTKGNKKTRQ